MKVLFLTDEFYPNFGANSLLVRTLAEEFIKNEHQVFVMPFSRGKDLPEVEEWRGIQIVRTIPDDDKKSLVYNLKKGKPFIAWKIGWKYLFNKIAKKETLKSKDRIAARKILEDFIKENQINVVVSICCSVELSFPLLYLRKRNKLPCKWIFYMIDPFESHSYYRGIEEVPVLREIQHDIMMHCDGIVATGLIYNDIKLWETEEVLKKITVVEFPKIEKPVMQPCDDDITLDKEKINVVCTGSKNEVVRSSAYTLQLCRQLKDEKIVFHFIGHGWSVKEKEKYGNCIFYQPRSHQAVRNLQMQADYLLNIGNVVTNQLPSKVLEYISTGKPIVNVFKTEKCPTLLLMQSYDALNVFEEDEIESAVSEIKEFISAEHIEMDFEEIKQRYEIYTPSYAVKQWLTLIKG